MKIGTTITLKKIEDNIPYLDKGHFPSPKAAAKAIKALCNSWGEDELEECKSLFPEELHLKFEEEMRQYRKNFHYETVMSLVDIVLDNHGVEAITLPEEIYASAVYSNTGETYAPTVLYDIDKQNYYIHSWGDWYENNGGLQ